jgi:hypothetical protein
LQHAGFISYRSGCVTVLDRSGLEEHACECYSTVKMELDRLLDPDYPESAKTWQKASNEAGSGTIRNFSYHTVSVS